MQNKPQNLKVDIFSVCMAIQDFKKGYHGRERDEKLRLRALRRCMY